MPAGAASRYALGAGGVGAARPAPAASLISASRYALGARRTALRAEGAARRGAARLCARRRSRWLPSPPRATRSAPRWRAAPGAWAPIRQPGRGLALRARHQRRRALHARAPTCAPPVAHVVSWGWWGCQRRRALCAARDARCNARFALLPRARVGGGSQTSSCASVRGNACVLPQHVQCESARRASATGAPYPQARPTPRTLSARARLHAAGEGRHDGHDDLNVAS